MQHSFIKNSFLDTFAGLLLVHQGKLTGRLLLRKYAAIIQRLTNRYVVATAFLLYPFLFFYAPPPVVLLASTHFLRLGPKPREG
jgi:hypothetical protein